MSDWQRAATWPRERLGEAIEALAAELDAGSATGSAGPGDDDVLDRWIEQRAGRLGMEALPVSARPRELAALFRSDTPTLVRAGDGFLAVAGVRRGQVRLLLPAGGRLAVPVAALCALLVEPMASSVRPDIARVAQAVVPLRRVEQAIVAMVGEKIADAAIDGLWLLRLPAGARMRTQFADAGLHWRLARIVALFALLYGTEAWGWSLIGGATLAGQFDLGWLVAWLLLLVSLLPVRLLAGWNEARFALDGGRLVKARLLAGAMALPLDAVRRDGVGRFVGRVMESQALETLALGGGFAVIMGAVELMLAAWVLHLGAAAAWHLVLLGGFGVLTLLMASGFHRAIGRWTNHRLAMTEYLIEAMTGHRTRLAQEQVARRDAAEDAQLAGYHRLSRQMDGATVRLGNLLGTAWNACAIAALAPALAGGEQSTARLAISLGGIVLAGRALRGMGQGLASLSMARLAWRRVAEIFRSGREEAVERPLAVLPHSAGDGVVVEGRELHFAHEHGRAVLAGAGFALKRGDRVLVEGPSGGGKSTLAALITGQRRPDGGLLLLEGLDRPSLGEEWHRRVTSAPQFHENHVFSGTLAFNLLMGRHWPPQPGDLEEAGALCRELGLGPLIERMPGGLHQRVGETGWQLSHGERSRVFLARALLQGAPVTVLDESFAALDPATMAQCLETTLARSETLVVIAHP